eukprot:scaffold1403_cov241-Pinguiococcus_pyrenoidosus.AAC.3
MPIGAKTSASPRAILTQMQLSSRSGIPAGPTPPGRPRTTAVPSSRMIDEQTPTASTAFSRYTFRSASASAEGTESSGTGTSCRVRGGAEEPPPSSSSSTSPGASAGESESSSLKSSSSAESSAESAWCSGCETTTPASRISSATCCRSAASISTDSAAICGPLGASGCTSSTICAQCKSDSGPLEPTLVAKVFPRASSSRTSSISIRESGSERRWRKRLEGELRKLGKWENGKMGSAMISKSGYVNPHIG